MGPAISVLLPVGVGVVAGVVVVGNLLQWLLHHFRKPTLGALIGLLLGSTVGLWPFQQGHEPQVGDTIKGRIVTAETLTQIDPEDWRTELFAPTPGQAATSIGLIGLGFALTVGIARYGRDEDV